MAPSLLQGTPRGSRRLAAHSPPVRREAVTGPGDDHGAGMVARRVEGLVPGLGARSAHAHRRGQEGVEQRPHVGPAGPDVVPHRLTHLGAGRGRAVETELEHGPGSRLAAGAGVAQASQAGPGRLGPAFHRYGGEGGAHRGLERRLPTGVDVDQLGNGAGHLDPPGEALGAGAGPSLIEGRSQGIGSGGPGVASGVGGPQAGLAPGPLVLGSRPLVGRRLLPGAGLVVPAPAQVEALGQLLALDLQQPPTLLERLGPQPGAGELGVGPLQGRPQAGRRRPRLPQPCARPARRLRSLPPARARPEAGQLGGQVGLALDQALDLGRQAGGRLLGGRQLGGHPAGLVLQGRHHRLVDRCGPVARHPPAPLGQHGGQAPGLLPQPLRPGHQLGQPVGPGRHQLPLGGLGRQIEAGQLGPKGGLLAGEPIAGVLAGGLATGQGGQLPPGQVEADGVELSAQVAVATGCLGLALQGPELAAHLPGEVAEAHEVGLGRGQAALGLLLAPPELQHARRLFDDGPAFLGPGLEHGLELALAHDHVLGSTHARVAQQLLDVEEAAGDLVDGILAGPVAEQGAADGHLGEVDRQHARGVVDGQAHLGPAQRRPAGGAGEDDVVHLRRPQGARALGTEHPGHGVDHVGLAAAVGADHHGDPRLEVQGRGVGEGLEAPQGQALEVHVAKRLGQRRHVPGDLGPRRR